MFGCCVGAVAWRQRIRDKNRTVAGMCTDGSVVRIAFVVGSESRRRAEGMNRGRIQTVEPVDGRGW